MKLVSYSKECKLEIHHPVDFFLYKKLGKPNCLFMLLILLRRGGMVQSEESLSLRAQKNWNPPMLLPLPTDFLRLTPPPHQVRRTLFHIVLLLHGKYESGMTFAFQTASPVPNVYGWFYLSKRSHGYMQFCGRIWGEKTGIQPLATSCIQGILQVFTLQNKRIRVCTSLFQIIIFLPTCLDSMVFCCLLQM